MESPVESSTDESYRIPSSVFSPDTPTKRSEWSITSNESLFSIQIGRSFTRDEFLWRSDELGSPGVYMPSPANNPIPTQSADDDGKSDEVGKPETTVDTLEGIKRESEDQNAHKSNVEARIAHRSVESMASEKSFAFPILAGQADKDGPDTIGGPFQQQPMSETLPNQENEPLKSPESENPQGEAQPAQTTWFSYFSCCTCAFRS